MWGIFKRKKRVNFDEPFAVIETTETGINNFINDKFNKKICIYSNWDNYMKKNIMKEITFTEEDARNLKEIYDMPVIEETLETDFDFHQEENFGEIMRVR